MHKGKPTYDELCDALHAALVCIADKPTFLAEEKMIRNLLQRDQDYQQQRKYVRTARRAENG